MNKYEFILTFLWYWENFVVVWHKGVESEQTLHFRFMEWGGSILGKLGLGLEPLGLVGHAGWDKGSLAQQRSGEEIMLSINFIPSIQNLIPNWLIILPPKERNLDTGRAVQLQKIKPPFGAKINQYQIQLIVYVTK